LIGCASVACCRGAGASAPTPPTSWRFVTCTGCKQVIETLRAALEALAIVAPAWLGGLIPPEWARRYGQRGDDWRLPRSEHACIDQAIQVGRDGLLPLEAVYGPDAPAGLAGVEAVQVLRRPGSSSSTLTTARFAGATSTAACHPAAG
jgi:hypothetical protein